MPPGVANKIRLVDVTPTNGACPITVNDYDIGLSLGFEGLFCDWYILLPFLQWADAAVAAGNLPTKA